MKKTNKFFDWIEGDRVLEPHTERTEPTVRKASKKKKKQEAPAKSLNRFLTKYRVLICMIAVLLTAALLITVLNFPEYGSASNPTNNEVVERYVGSGYEETGATNAITGLILNYRGFDTFGESCVLFLAACCVITLLERDKKTFTAEDLKKYETEEAAEKKDIILARVTKLLIPCLMCFAFAVLFYGHISPGGGFAGGSILGASIILYSLAFGMVSMNRFMNEKVHDVIHIVGLIIYGVMFFLYILCSANGVEYPLAKFIVSVINVVVGLVVMTTMYSFYTIYKKGEL